MVGEVRGRVPRHGQHVERAPRDLDGLAALEEHVGRVRPQPHLRRSEGGALEELALPGGHVHGRARALGEVGDTEQVVPVAMRHEDRGAARAHPCEEQA